MRPDATLPWKRMTMSLEPNTSQNKAPKHSKWHQPVRVDSPTFSSLMPMDSQLDVLLHSIQIHMSQNWTGTRNRYQGGSNDRFRWVNWLCCKLRSGQVLSWYLQCFSNKKNHLNDSLFDLRSDGITTDILIKVLKYFDEKEVFLHIPHASILLFLLLYLGQRQFLLGSPLHQSNQ